MTAEEFLRGTPLPRRDAPVVNFTVRPEAAADAGAVHALLARAFETPAEADLVDQLRRDGDLLLALVATDAAQAVVGHVAFPRLRVESAGGEWPAVGLAPLAVAEPQRRGGIGAALVRAASRVSPRRARRWYS